MQTDSSRGGKDVLGAVRRHPAAFFVAAIVLSALCFQVIPGQADVPGGLVAQGAALAALALAGVALVRPSALGFPRAAFGGLGRWAGLVLVVGLAAGFASWWMAGAPAVPAGEWMPRAAAVAALCLLTGVYEEGVFRVMALEALALHLTPVRAALASAVLFGVLHASLGEAQALGGAVAWAQGVLKLVQAGLFGFFMAVLYLRTRNLWVVAGMHAMFDLAYLGPLMLATGMQPGYVTGEAGDLAMLMATIVLLVPAAIVAFKNICPRA